MDHHVLAERLVGDANDDWDMAGDGAGAIVAGDAAPAAGSFCCGAGGG